MHQSMLAPPTIFQTLIRAPAATQVDDLQEKVKKGKQAVLKNNLSSVHTLNTSYTSIIERAYTS